jgi:hypothetical protein
MKKILGSIALIIALHSSSHADVLPLDNGIDVRHYDFQLELNDNTDVIAGTATIQIVFRKDLSSFELDLANKNVDGKGMVVSDVVLNGKSLQFNHEKGKLKISLPRDG